MHNTKRTSLIILSWVVDSFGFPLLIHERLLHEGGSELCFFLVILMMDRYEHDTKHPSFILLAWVADDCGLCLIMILMKDRYICAKH